METFLFCNPVSGNYQAAAVSCIAKSLHGAGLNPRLCSLFPSEQADEAFRSIHQASETPLVIVAAGDGTLNAVVNRLEPGRVSLAVLPLGTSNVLAAELGITSLDDGVARIIAGQTRALTVGVMENERETRRFVLMAGFGFDGAVVRDVSLFWKKVIKQGAYGVSALTNSLVWHREGGELLADGRTVACHSVVICNAARYGGRFVLAREASLFSTELVAVCIRNNSRRTYLRLAADLACGEIDRNPDLLILPLSECEIRGRLPAQLDGDFAGYSPARISALPGFARLVV